MNTDTTNMNGLVSGKRLTFPDEPEVKKINDQAGFFISCFLAYSILL